MQEVFLTSFGSVFSSVLMLFLIAFFAGFLVKKKVITQDIIKAMSVITVNILLPSLIFSKITGNFNPKELSNWWIIPLFAIGTVGIGLLFSALLFAKSLKRNRDLLPVSSMMNAGYLILPIGQVVYPAQFDQFAVYCSLYILGISPLIWSIGKFLLCNEKGSKLKLKELVTPPLIANIIAISLGLTGWAGHIPGIIAQPIDLLGTATVPIATLVLGATLGSLDLKKLPGFFVFLRVGLVRFIITPLIILFLVHRLGIRDENSLLSDLLIIESASPTATALILQLRKYGGDWKKIGSIILVNYILGLFFIPFWLSVWKIL